MSVHIDCAQCGVEFCMPEHLEERRRKDHQTFYCPNGHGNVYNGKTEDEKKIERLERSNEMWQALAQREELLGVVKECPVPGCSFRSRKQIPRSAMDMGRGIERVRADLFEHLVRDHAGRVPEARQLTAGATDG